MCPHGDAVDKLHGTPQSVKLDTLVHMHDPIAGQRPTPDRVIQEGPDPSQDDLEHGQATAETLLGQQVPLSRYGNLLWKGQNVAVPWKEAEVLKPTTPVLFLTNWKTVLACRRGFLEASAK